MPIPTPITLGQKEVKEKTYNFGHGKPLDLMPEAVAQVKAFAGQHPEETKSKFFRVCVEGGGCNGMQYSFTFDEQKPADHVIACQDIKVLLDKNAESFVMGSVVDYVADHRGAGFIVKNPQSKSECGCGISFSV